MYAAMICGLLSLLMAGPFWFVIGFAVISGLAYGTILPLHGLYTAEIFGKQQIGTLMGAQTTIISLFAASGPFVLGLTVDFTGGYGMLMIISILATALAIPLLGFGEKPPT